MARRCPACNANRNNEKKIGENLMGRQCVVCHAQWLGELYTNEEVRELEAVH